jgi:DNA-binding Lrp family transcriptional regulator
MSVIRVSHDKDNPYLLVNRETVRDNTISLKARGLLIYMLSFADGWEFYVSEIARRNKISEETITNILKELFKAGYCKREKINGEHGRFTYNYEIFESIDHTAFTRDGGTTDGELGSKNNKSKNQQEDTTTPDSPKHTLSFRTLDVNDASTPDPKHTLSFRTPEVHDLDSDQLKFIQIYRKEWETHYKGKYPAHDWKAVKRIKDSLKMVKYIKLFLANRVCDDHMQASDHKISVFAYNISKIKELYKNTTDYQQDMNELFRINQKRMSEADANGTRYVPLEEL